MIALLDGVLAHATLDEVLVEVGGVGLRVRVPPGEVTDGVGARVTLHTHLAVREDALTLYGFASAAARDLFETLLGVSGVGPKLALAALGTLGADGLRRAVAAEDIAALTVVPGVGRKSAQRLVLELAERIDLDPGLSGTLPAGRSDAQREVREALAALGYAPAEVQAALEAAGEAPDGPEQLLRAALRAIGGRERGGAG